MSRVFRVQDREGRGPFRPGFSRLWLDEDIGERAELPSWIEEFGPAAFGAAPDGAHGFSAVRTLDKLRAWFSASETERLVRFGFVVVEVPDAHVICESEHQVLCWRDRPLADGVMRRAVPRG